MPLSDDNSGFRLHREPTVPVPDEEKEAGGMDWPEAVSIIAFFAFLGFVFWLFLK